jgi:uncharacterized protein (DUF697 family)
MAKKTNAEDIRAKLTESLDVNSNGGNLETSPSTMTINEPTTQAPVTSDISLTPDKIINSSMLLAAGAGAIPLPIWDTAAVTVVQVKMLADLSAHYGVPFKQNLGQNAVAALLGGLAPAMIARGALGSILKGIPGVGSIFGAVLQPAFAAAITYAIGRIFINHYESGGTLLTFSPSKFKDTFTEEVKAGMKKVRDIKI